MKFGIDIYQAGYNYFNKAIYQFVYEYLEIILNAHSKTQQNVYHQICFSFPQYQVARHLACLQCTKKSKSKQEIKQVN